MRRRGASDFDDGIDLDKSGDASIVGIFLLTSARENFEQGFDLNENVAGDLSVDMTLLEAIDNAEEGIEYEEADDFAGCWEIVAILTGVKRRGNGEADGDAGPSTRTLQLVTFTASGNGAWAGVVANAGVTVTQTP